jgi:quinol monooxygenase YgiN
MPEVHVIVRFQAKPESVATVQELLTSFVGPSLRDKECLYYRLYQELGDPTVFFIWDGWANQSALDRHAHDPHVLDVVAKLEPHLAAPTMLRVTRQLA